MHIYIYIYIYQGYCDETKTPEGGFRLNGWLAEKAYYFERNSLTYICIVP